MHWRPSGLGLRSPVSQQQWRRLLARLLSSPALDTISPSGPRLHPAPPEALPPSAIAGALEPFRRQLWRRRALLVLIRAALLGLLWLAAAAVARRLWLEDLSSVVLAVPVLALAPAALWGAFAQRPTIGETARLLDRDFRLHDQIGTSVELGSAGPPGSIAAQQVQRAAILLGRVPARPWRVSLLQQGERPLMIVLGCVLLGAAVTTSSPRSTAASFHAVAHGSPRMPLPPAIVPARTGTLRAAASRPGQIPRTAQVPLPRTIQPFTLAASLQMRTGPQTILAGSSRTAAATPGSIPVALHGASGQIRSRNSPSSASGRSTTPAPRSTAAAGQNTSGSPGGAQGQAHTGTAAHNSTAQGQGASAGPQAAAQGQQAGQTGTLGQPASPQTASTPATRPAHQTGKQGAPSSGSSPRSNPFGSGPSSSGTHSTSGGTATPSSRTRAGAGTGSQGKTGANRGRSQSGSSSTQDGANGGSLSPAAGRRSAPGGPSPAHAQQPAPARQAGTATGPQITLGGRPAAGGGPGTGTQLVRVVPLNAPPVAAQTGSLTLGPGQAQGYVPEENMQLSPAEQALLRAYFSQGSN